MAETPAEAIVVMGVSGCGKSTLGEALARALDCPFLEGDAFHSPANVAKMTAGAPLTDDDRRPWLDALGAAAADAVRQDGRAILACSALKRAYRDRLRAAIGAPVLFVLLDAPKEDIAGRMAARSGHFMPATLLDSQFRTLERPAEDERALSLDARAPVESLRDMALAALGANAL